MCKGRIVIAGDLFPNNLNVSFFKEGDVETLFGKGICDLFAAADLSICNLEGSLTDHPERCRKTGPVKVAPTDAVEAIKKLGVDYCMLANNHITDGGHRGVLDTMKVLDDAGIGYIGSGKDKDHIVRSVVKEVAGMKVGIYNVSETMYNKPKTDSAGSWLYDEYIVCQEIKDLKSRCGYLIVIYHGGVEKFQYPSPETRKRFHRMADSGADMVLSQHTHCVGSEEYFDGSYLLYGQGDFLLRNFAPGLTDSGLIIELVIEKGNVDVRKHLVKSVDNQYVRYDEIQDLTEFNERTKRVSDERFVYDQFKKFCDNELRLYLAAFKSPSKIRLKLNRLFPKQYNNWLYKYNERDLLFSLHTLRSEQNRETAIVGIEDLLNLD